MTPGSGVPPAQRGRLYLGWQFATLAEDPGPPPTRPVPAEPTRFSNDWLAAQRREENRITRVPKVIAGVGTPVAILLAACTGVGWVPAGGAAPAIAICLLAAGASGYAIWQRERVLRALVADELTRVERFRTDQERLSIAHRAEHYVQTAEWKRKRSAFVHQKRWYCVSVPEGIDRVDVAGGTLAGWSALLTMSGAHRLAEGGEVTVIDLSGGAIAADLIGLAERAAATPAVWVLPGDLPRLDIAASLTREELAEVLGLAVSVAEERGSARDLAIDTAILDRIIGALDAAGAVQAGPVAIGRVAAALRALVQIGDPQADVAAGLLTEHEISAVTALFGSGATDRVILDRALGIEAQLRALAETGALLHAAAAGDSSDGESGASGSGAGGSRASESRARLRVVAVDGRVSPQAARLFGGFAVAALTQLIGRLPTGHSQAPWEHTVFLLGADRLRDDVLDRLTDTCERTRTGLVLGYRSMPAQVRQRIGRGRAAVAFMRLGNAEEAKAASEQLGSEHRFVVSQLTETIGTSVTDTVGASYTTTTGGSVSAAVSTAESESTSRGSGRSRSASRGMLQSGEGAGSSASVQHGTTWGTTESASLTAGISTSTAWGVSTSKATGDSESLARSLQRSRELVVEPSELQRLPATAMLVSYDGPTGRHVLLADANPAIGDLPVATMTSLAEAIQVRGAAPYG